MEFYSLARLVACHNLNASVQGKVSLGGSEVQSWTTISTRERERFNQKIEYCITVE